MAKKLIIINEKVYRTFKLPNGKLVDVYSCGYRAKVDLLNETYISHYDSEYNESILPTFQELVNQGIVTEVTCIENTYEIKFTNFTRGTLELNSSDIESIIDEFKEHGFNVSKKAILHNYEAWLCDMKSGFRSNRNNYHLFSPCGCNPLSFTATTLHPLCKEWQKTYES